MVGDQMADSQASKTPGLSAAAPGEEPLHAPWNGGTGAPGFSPPAVSWEEQKTVISRQPPPVASPPTRRMSAAEQVAQQLVGQRLSHFVLEEFIGGGGMGAVFRATDTALGRTVAIKVVSGASHDEEALRRFKNEAQSAARLDHPNIARVYYVGADKGWDFIVFEYVQGVNLRDLVAQRGPLPIDEAISYAVQVAAALEHAFQRDVVHRDIKPSNVLVTADGVVKLVDMGLARLQMDTTDELTASGVTLGTFDYISPEQARDPRQADVRSDLYSLGCTLFFMLTGRPPFPVGTVLQKLLSHSSVPPPDPRQFRDDVPAELAAVVLKLLAKSPADRYQTPSELVAELVLLAEQLGIAFIGFRPAVVVAPASPTPQWRQTLPWVAAVVGIVVVAWLLELLSGPESIAIGPPRLPVANDASSSVAPPKALQTGSPPLDSLSTGEMPVPVTPPTSTSDGSANASASPSGTDRGSLGASISSATADASSPPMQPSEPVSPTPASSPASATAAPTSESPMRFPSDKTEGTPAPALSQSPTAAPSSSPTSGPESGNATGPMVASTNTAPATAQVVTGPSVDSNVPPVPRIRRIIVSPVSVEVPADALLVSSLMSAFDKVAHLENVDRIELWHDGPMEVRSQVINIPERLEVHAGAGFRPVIWFRPQIGIFGSETRFLTMRGGNFLWNGIDIVALPPADVSTDLALFALDDIDSFQLQDVTISVLDAAAQPEKVRVLELLPSRMAPSAEMRMPLAATMRLPPRFHLERVAVRGAVTMLYVSAAQPLELLWQQGLLITPGRLIQIGGTSDAYNWDAEWQIRLEHITAAVEKGLAAVVVDTEGSRPLDGSLELYDCVLMTSHDVPLIDFRGVASFDQAEKALRFRGDRNFYPTRMSAMMGMNRAMRRIRWRILTRDGLVREYGFDDKDAEWYEEKSAKESVLWKELPPAFADVPAHRQTRAQYEMDTSARNPARAAGFDPALLREFPATPAPVPLDVPAPMAPMPLNR